MIAIRDAVPVAIAYDERPYVRAVVGRYGTDHHETLPSASDMRELLDRMVWHMDEPAAGPGILLQLKVCELTRRSGVIVINGGQGGDEEWGGYFGYVPAYIKMLARQARKDPLLIGEIVKDSLLMLGRTDTRSALLKALPAGRRGRLEASSALGGTRSAVVRRAGGLPWRRAWVARMCSARARVSAEGLTRNSSAKRSRQVA